MEITIERLATSPTQHPKLLGRRERKRQNLQDHLAQTAWRLFEEQGYDAVRMDAIAEAADVAKATLYKHFTEKAALLAHYLRHSYAADLRESLQDVAALPNTRARLTTMLAHTADWAESHRAIMGPYVRYRSAEMSVDLAGGAAKGVGILHLLAGLLAQGQAQGDIAADCDIAQLADYFHALYITALKRWVSNPAIHLHEEFNWVVDFVLRAAQPLQNDRNPPRSEHGPG